MRLRLLTIAMVAALWLDARAWAEMPKAEIDFVATINDARTVYDAQPTPAKKTALVKEMVKRWKTILPGGMIEGWTGTVVQIGKNNGGRFHLAVRIADRINLMTWEKAFTDFGHGTLIGAKSPLYPVVAALKPGDVVRFSGKYLSFVNLHERAKVFDTDLIVMFSAISPAP